MRIGTIAREAGVNVQTLRYYERRGLLPRACRLASGYREYDAATVTLVRFIKNAQELGFTLREIGELIELRATRSRSQLEVRGLVSSKIEDVNRRIAHLESLRSELRTLVEKCEQACPDEDCCIIEALDESSPLQFRVRQPSHPEGGTQWHTIRPISAAATAQAAPVRAKRAAPAAETAADRRQRRNRQ